MTTKDEVVAVNPPSIIVTAEWVINHHDGRKDHACAECISVYDGTSTAIDGFQCVFHRALYVQAFPAASAAAPPAHQGAADERVAEIESRLRDDIPAMKPWRVLYIEDCRYLLSLLAAKQQPTGDDSEVVRESNQTAVDIIEEWRASLPDGSRMNRNQLARLAKTFAFALRSARQPAAEMKAAMIARVNSLRRALPAEKPGMISHDMWDLSKEAADEHNELLDDVIAILETVDAGEPVAEHPNCKHLNRRHPANCAVYQCLDCRVYLCDGFPEPLYTQSMLPAEPSSVAQVDEETCQRAIRLMLALKTGDLPIATTNYGVTSFVFEGYPYEIRPSGPQANQEDGQ